MKKNFYRANLFYFIRCASPKIVCTVSSPFLYIFQFLDIYLLFFLSQPTTNTKKIFFFLDLQGSPAMVTIALGVHTDFCIKLCINSKEFLSLFHFLNNYCNHASSPPQPLCATIFPTHHLNWRHVVSDNISFYGYAPQFLYKNSDHPLLPYPTFPSVENPTMRVSMDLSLYFWILIYIY